MSSMMSPSRSRTVCVIFNPAAGKKRGWQRLEAALPGWRSKAEFWPTERPGHAVELARRAALGGFEIVAAAGGDGTVHEVANGLLQAGRPEVCLAVLPLGSADDYAYSLAHDRDESRPDPGGTRLVDAGVVRIDGRAEHFFVCCLGLGFGPCVTMESQRIRRLQGQLLYGVAALRAMWRRWGHLDLTGSLNDEPLPAGPTLTVSVMLGRREGGFMMAPEARLDDGWFDCVHAGRLTRWEALRLIPSLSTTGPPGSHPKLGFRRCRRLLIESKQSLAIHADGEMLCRPEDQVRRVEVELRPLCLPVRLGLDGIDT
jgi:diacylglycerol kinase family enzyme